MKTNSSIAPYKIQVVVISPLPRQPHVHNWHSRCQYRRFPQLLHFLGNGDCERADVLLGWHYRHLRARGIGFQVGILQRELALLDGMSVATLCSRGYLGLPYALLMPARCVPDDVVATLVSLAESLRNHHLVLCQPNLELLMPSPVTIGAMLLLAKESTARVSSRRLTALSQPIAACGRLGSCRRSTLESPH